MLLEHFKNVVKDYNLSDEVHLVGRLTDEDLTELFKISDVSVIPTIGLEGFGIATVESLFHGVPVIGTEIGGTTEILAPLSADLLIDKPTPEKIYQKIVKIINKEIILPTRKACQEYAVAHYDINNVAPKVVRCTTISLKITEALKKKVGHLLLIDSLGGVENWYLDMARNGMFSSGKHVIYGAGKRD